MKSAKLTKGRGVISAAYIDKDFLINKNNYRIDLFRIVAEFPDGYQIWNIGRENFPFPCYIPVCIIKDDNYHVDLNSLVAVRCPNEDVALRLLQMAGKRTVDKNRFKQVVEVLA